MIGFPIIWITFVVARVLADLERMRANVLLDTDVARLYLPDERGWWKRLKSRAEDPSTWLTSTAVDLTLRQTLPSARS